MVKLLLRLYEPTAGRILLNGIDVKEIDYKEYLKLFSTVFQDFKIFAFKISDNVTSLENKAADLTGVHNSLERVGLSSKINALDKGVETYLYKIYEEDGIELSGGEAQKLAIARALYKDAPVVILDEPTAALDPKAEAEIFQNFQTITAGKTAVLVSHRLSSCRFCDCIVVLEHGNIIEQGTHEVLMRMNNGKYREMFTAQAEYYHADIDDKENINV